MSQLPYYTLFTRGLQALSHFFLDSFRACSLYLSSEFYLPVHPGLQDSRAAEGAKFPALCVSVSEKQRTASCPRCSLCPLQAAGPGINQNPGYPPQGLPESVPGGSGGGMMGGHGGMQNGAQDGTQNGTQDSGMQGGMQGGPQGGSQESGMSGGPQGGMQGGPGAGQNSGDAAI